MKKISFLGDIMCEKPFLREAIRRNNDYYSAFAPLQNLLSESDFVVSNLETPIAGEKLEYTKDLYSFNTPSAFLDSLKKLKIDLYLTANNHCLDRGIQGLENTLYELDKREMLHTGTARSIEEQQKIFIQEFDNTSCAFLSYNAFINEDKWFKFKNNLYPYSINNLIDIDLLINYRENYRTKTIKHYQLRKKFGNLIPMHFDLFLKRKLGFKFKPYIDNEPLREIQGKYLDIVKKDIAKAKQKADIIFTLPHCGGQFNITPGRRSIEIFEKLFEFGSDAVIASHPHVVQEIKFFDNKPCVYSLGNVSMSMSSPYLIKESIPQFGIIFNVYIDNKKICKTSFSIIKILEENHYPIIYPIDEIQNNKNNHFLENEVDVIYKRITGDLSFPGIQREYSF